MTEPTDVAARAQPWQAIAACSTTGVSSTSGQSQEGNRTFQDPKSTPGDIIHHAEVTSTPHSAISPRYEFFQRGSKISERGERVPMAAIVRRAIRRELEREGVLKGAKR